MLVITSGLVILFQGSGNSQPNVLPANQNSFSPDFNVTFHAVGLSNLYNGAEKWQLTLYEVGGPIDIFSSSTPTITAFVPSGIYYYTANDTFQTLFPFNTYYSPQFGVTSNTIIDVNFSTPHSITFQENGLASNYKWGVFVQSLTSGDAATHVHTANAIAAAGTPIVYYAISDNFQYSLNEYFNGVNTSISQNNIRLGTSNLTISVPLNYLEHITFNESGLPTGAEWYVQSIAGPLNMAGEYVEETANNITLNVANGLNTFGVGIVSTGNSLIRTSTISAIVGSQNDISVILPKLYELNITPANLPSSAVFNSWGLSGSFTYGTLSSNINVGINGGQTLNLLLPNGTINFTPSLVMNYKAGGSSSAYNVANNAVSLSVAGSNQTQPLKFESLYHVNLSLENLPSTYSSHFYSQVGKISNYVNSRADNYADLLAPNGTYQFYYGVTNTSNSVSSSGFPIDFTVNGASLSKAISLYTMHFSSEYTQSGYSIFVGKVSNLASLLYDNYFQTSVGPGESINFPIENGSYAYEILMISAGPSNIGYMTSNGTFKVSGANVNILGQFPTSYYKVTINSAGLPAGADISYYINSIDEYFTISTELSNSTSEPVVVWLPEGSYVFYDLSSVSGNTQYYANETYLNVSSGVNTLNLKFSTNSYLTVLETGLPAGTPWSIEFNGKLVKSTTNEAIIWGNISRTLYFNINPVANYYPNPSSGSFIPLNVPYYIGIPTQQFTMQVKFTPELLGSTTTTGSSLNISSFNLGTGLNYSIFNGLAIHATASDPYTGLTYIAYTNGTTGLGVSSLLVVKSSNYNLVANIHLPADSDIYQLTVDQATGTVFALIQETVSGHYSYYIGSLNTTTFKMTLSPATSGEVNSLTIDQKTGMLYASSTSDIFELNPVNLSIIADIPITSQTFTFGGPIYSGINVVYSNQTNLIYITGYLLDGIQVLDPSNNSLLGTFEIPGGLNLDYGTIGNTVLDAANGILYFTYTNYSESGIASLVLYGFKTTSDTFISPVNLGGYYSQNMAYNGARGLLYIPVQPSGGAFMNNINSLALGQLLIYQISSGKVVSAIQLATDPFYISSGQTNSNVMVTSAYTNDVQIISPNDYGYISGNVSKSLNSVTIDGYSVPVINGHFATAVNPGTYYITASGNGYSPVVQNVSVNAFSTNYVNISLGSSVTTYNVTGTVSPEQASVMFNGFSAAVNATGHYQIYLPGGKYTASSYLDGYFPTSRTVQISGNTVINLNLTKMPSPESSLSKDNLTAVGFNISINGIDLLSNDAYSVVYNSSANGTLLLSVHLSNLSGTNISDILESRVFINGVQYTNFSITFTYNYTVILKVMGLKGDPTLVWAYGPAYVAPSANSPVPLLDYAVAAIAFVAVLTVIGAIYFKGKRKK